MLHLRALEVGGSAPSRNNPTFESVQFDHRLAWANDVFIAEETHVVLCFIPVYRCCFFKAVVG